MALYPTFGATHALAGYSPQQSLTLIAVCGCGGGPHLEVMWCSAGYGVNQSLQGLLVHMIFLQRGCFLFNIYHFLIQLQYREKESIKCALAC